MKLTLIRHGDCNSKGIYVGARSNPSLSFEGVKQIERVKDLITADTVYTSSLKRSIESGYIISKDIHIINELNEIDFGLWDGLSSDDIQKSWYKEYNTWVINPVDYTPPEGENFKDFYKRVSSFINRLKKTDQDSILVVHGGVIRLIIVYLLQLDIYKDFWKFYADYGSITQLEVFDDFARIIKIDNF